jgi:predicted enzyme related to lactoylglutathione lyase
MDMGPMGVYQIFAIDGVAKGGMMTKTADMPMPLWLYYFTVDDIESAVGRVKNEGGQILLEPHQVPGGMWITQCFDPQGAMFALVGPKRQSASASAA